VPSRRPKSEFLANYRVDDTYTLRPRRDQGRPGIYMGSAADGNPVLIKTWPRAVASNDEDLLEIWRHEVRQLHRLAGYPGASACIAHLYDAGSDAQGFYLILAAGQRRPLHALLNTIPNGHWLLQPKQSANRGRIWRNLALLARGIETLHSQGLLHRSIDKWAVLTSGSEDPDFQLTGFEWSMRVVGAETKPNAAIRLRGSSAHDSFLRDWQMYGMLAAELLGAKQDRLLMTAIPSHEVADHLSAEEVTLLRNIVQLQPILALGGELIESRIDSIVRSLHAAVAHRSPKLHIAIRLGRDSPLSDRIRQSSDNEVENDDIEGQLGFVKDDLEEPMLIAVHPKNPSDGMRLILRGKNLLYGLQQFRPEREGNGTWEFAYCESAERQAPAAPHIIGSAILEPSSLELLPLGVAYAQYPRARGKLRSWDEYKKQFLAEDAPQSRQQIVHKALSLLQLLETLYATANVFPIELVNQTDAVSSDASTLNESIIRVRSRVDRERDNLARALRLKSPSLRLQELLTGDGVKPDGWILSDSKSLGDKSPADTEWRFQDIDRQKGRADLYVFSGLTPAPSYREAVLVAEDSVGTDKQFRRRLKALRALKEHDELLQMMADPRSRIIDSHDPVPAADEFLSKLDESKQAALRELTATLPLYLVQGPPGVGKTRLVRDLVQRRFKDEPTSRLLLSAQSNAAIDHLMDELESVLITDAAQPSPLIVRCGRLDGQEASSKFDIATQSRELVRKLADSDLAKRLPPKLQHALGTLGRSCTGSLDVDITAGTPSDQAVLGRAIPQALRAFEGAVARAANVVFATTNSSELERLIEERAQCDWVIVEEAAKATGSELVSPMLLSHRRLMIGDHKQLSAFGSPQLTELLERPEEVMEALLLGAEFIGRSLRDASTDEILDELDDDEREEFPALCSEALRVLAFFETTIESEFQRQERRGKGRPIAKQLSEQHRMHPVVASLVSRCFYKGALKSHPECASRFETSPRPFISTDPNRLPVSPIVVVNMPYIQAAIGNEHGERHPRWHNPAEARAVAECIQLIAPLAGTIKPPTLAVLSPYSQQVNRLRDSIRDVPSLQGFRAPSHAGVYCHTVDSFQGSEADLVIVSLVRNNGHANVRNAFGFLSDSRRMNVLLSRARWQLVLVASLGFLEEVVDASRAAGGDQAETAAFVGEMLDEIDEKSRSGGITIVPYLKLMERERK
jgi:hypothetical protein